LPDRNKARLNLDFTEKARKKIAAFTTKYQNQRVLIRINNVIVARPIIREPIISDRMTLIVGNIHASNEIEVFILEAMEE